MRTLLKTNNINAFVATRIDGISYVVEKTKSIDINITFVFFWTRAIIFKFRV